MEASEIREKSLLEYLASMGIQPVRRTSRSSVFFSPFRDEDFPSFHVYPSNRFCDFGNGAKGSIIDFVMTLKHCDFQAAMSILSNGCIVNIPKYEKKITRPKPGIEIVSVNSIHSEHLLSYLKQRCIPKQLADIYLKQVEFRFPEGKAPGTIHAALGFKTDSNSYELRSARWKVSNSPKNITTFKGTEGRISLFEGFFDYLGALVHFGTERLSDTTIVLNSLGFIHSILPFLKDTEYVKLFIDNGRAANEKTQMLKEEGVPYVDCREIFSPHQDFNDFLVAKNL